MRSIGRQVAALDTPSGKLDPKLARGPPGRPKTRDPDFRTDVSCFPLTQMIFVTERIPLLNIYLSIDAEHPLEIESISPSGSRPFRLAFPLSLWTVLFPQEETTCTGLIESFAKRVHLEQEQSNKKLLGAGGTKCDRPLRELVWCSWRCCCCLFGRF